MIPIIALSLYYRRDIGSAGMPAKMEGSVAAVFKDHDTQVTAIRLQ